MSHPLVVHCKRAPYDVYIGRGELGSIWGNPYKIGRDGTREQVVEKYRSYLLGNPWLMSHLPSLKGKVLGCWCAPQLCHGEVLAELANKETSMPRELIDHKVIGINDGLFLVVMDEPGAGGACHEYKVVKESGNPLCSIGFQNGPIKEAGVNGVTQEMLLAVVIDRLRGFQAGQYACRENAIALTHIEEALMWLKKRTMDRLARSVEGTSAK